MAVVLITRPEPGATQTATRVAALGLEPLVAPLMSINQRGDIARLPATVAATLLTSQNAVGGCPPTCFDMPAYAVGRATADRARDVGFRRVEEANGDAVALAALVGGAFEAQGGSLFLPVGLGQGGELATNLRHRGFRVLRRVVYEALIVRTLPQTAEAHLRHHSVHAALFFSGETARQFVRLVRAAKLDECLRDVEAVSISERSTMALRELTWRRIRVASKPNQDAMLALLR